MSGPYSVLYIDPPWAYADKCNAGKRGAAYKYPTLTVPELKRLPVADALEKLPPGHAVTHGFRTWKRLGPEHDGPAAMFETRGGHEDVEVLAGILLDAPGGSGFELPMRPLIESA